MENRCKPSFINYFEYLREIVGTIRVFVTDRNYTQIDAIKQVWPEALGLYCIRYIRKNIENICPNEILEEFDKMMKKEITEETMIATFNTYISNHINSTVSNFLQNLLEQAPHWLPSITESYHHRDNMTSNLVEGSFGTLKNLTEHKLQTLDDLDETIFLLAERQFLESLNAVRVSVPSQLLSAKDALQVGNFALQKIKDEYDLLHQRPLTVQYNDKCCQTNKYFGIPCRHLIYKRVQEYKKKEEEEGKEIKEPYLTINDFEPRWLHYYTSIPTDANTVSIKKAQKIDDNDWFYTACINRFERYFSAAN